MSSNNNVLTTEDFDRVFDEGKEDIIPYLDLSSGRRINRDKGENTDAKRVNVDLSAWMLNALDREAARLNISRQAVIKTMLDEKLRERGTVPA